MVYTPPLGTLYPLPACSRAGVFESMVPSRRLTYPAARRGASVESTTNVEAVIPSGRKTSSSTSSMKGRPAALESARPRMPKPMLEYW